MNNRIKMKLWYRSPSLALEAKIYIITILMASSAALGLSTLIERDKVTSDQGIESLKFSEGVEYTAYRNFDGEPWTICYGHTGTDVSEDSTATEKQCDDLLHQDLKVFEKAVNDNVTVVLYQWQFDSLVNFVYNVGIGAFESSTLLKELNSGGYNKVTTQLDNWVYVNGQAVEGQVNRRNREGLMFVGVGFDSYQMRKVIVAKSSLLRNYARDHINDVKFPELKEKLIMTVREQKESRMHPSAHNVLR